MKWFSVLLVTLAAACGLSAAEKAKSSTRSLNAIPGVSELVEAKLNAAGINNVNDLLAEGASRQGRDEVAARSRLPAEQILKLVQYADLFRLNGVGVQMAELLRAAGVSTVSELAQRNASALHLKLQEANTAKKGKLPTEQQVASWIAEAKALPKIVTD